MDTFLERHKLPQLTKEEFYHLKSLISIKKLNSKLHPYPWTLMLSFVKSRLNI